LGLAIGLPLLLIGLQATPVGADLFVVVVGEPALMLAWAAAGLWAAILTFRHVRRRAWRTAAMTAVLPVAVLSMCLRFTDLIHFCNDAGDVIHFLVRRPAYLATIRAMPANGEPRLHVFELGGMIRASRGLVYDESDEVVREPSQQSPGWKKRAEHSALSCDGYYARPFPGHFAFTQHWYLASFPC
jgi:hypothetical protein